jgi:hypothetical protein
MGLMFELLKLFIINTIFILSNLRFQDFGKILLFLFFATGGGGDIK